MINKPGIYPAINSAATDTPPLAIEYTISALLGGISRPLVDAVAVTAALKPRSYPSFVMAGIIKPPTAEAAAAAAPGREPNKVQRTTLTKARPPGNRPKNTLAKSIRRRATPPGPIQSPESTK